MNLFKLILSSIIGLGFFVCPINYQGKSTVVFDILVTWITKNYSNGVGYYCFTLILAGAVFSILSSNVKIKGLTPLLAYYKSSFMFKLLRILGLFLACMLLFRIGPEFILTPKISKLMWNVLVFSVGVIIPVGAIFLNIWISYGCLEFVGTLMRPLMRPLYRLPGRSALDDFASWIGSYSVGLYFTRKLLSQGMYTRREAFIIATCFSTVSIGFVGVVAATLNILNLFPLIFITYFFAIYFLTIILVRIWPVTFIPNTYVTTPNPEPEFKGSFMHYLKLAYKNAIDRANGAPSFTQTIREGLIDGLKLTTTILGTILTVGTIALMLVEYTSVFHYLGYPLIPILRLLGLPNPEIIAPATLVGITEVYIPALISKDAAIPAKFFIAVLSISQLIFFSSIGPMMMDMFKDIPIKFTHLVSLFFIRTAILIPLLAGIIYLLSVFKILN